MPLRGSLARLHRTLRRLRYGWLLEATLATTLVSCAGAPWEQGRAPSGAEAAPPRAAAAPAESVDDEAERDARAEESKAPSSTMPPGAGVDEDGADRAKAADIEGEPSVATPADDLAGGGAQRPAPSRPATDREDSFADAFERAATLDGSSTSPGSARWQRTRREPTLELAPIVDTSSWRWLFATRRTDRVGLDALAQLVSRTPPSQRVADYAVAMSWRPHPLEASRQVLALEVTLDRAPVQALNVVHVVALGSVAMRPIANAIARADSHTTFVVHHHGRRDVVRGGQPAPSSWAAASTDRLDWTDIDQLVQTDASMSTLVVWADGTPLREQRALQTTAQIVAERQAALWLVDTATSAFGSADLRKLARLTGASLLLPDELVQTNALDTADRYRPRPLRVRIEFDPSLVRRHRVLGYEALPDHAGRAGTRLVSAQLYPGQRVVVLVELELTRAARTATSRAPQLGRLYLVETQPPRTVEHAVALLPSPGPTSDGFAVVAALADVLSGHLEPSASQREQLLEDLERAVSKVQLDRRLLAPAQAWLTGGAR